MATKSILKTVEIKDNESAQKILEAITKAEKISVPIDNVKSTELHGNDIKQFLNIN